ncbi:isoaspartyl peptidase/L-asparaginase family protein [Sphingomonas sp. ID0503]|uniref:isoaspartyl peptidase/L-asparaginase family protein n=1 Tax=Sphingomonas sp. ID0503 TaxID=3399691 RepID=UPI003AFA0E74
MIWTLMIHGGSGSMKRGKLDAAQECAARAGLAAALEAGRAILATGGHALDAVQAAVEVLEDDPAFNAGRGSVFTHEGHIELDAAIMDGRDRRAGAVSSVTRTRHPVALARTVMDKSVHVLLSGAGADAFAEAHGAELVDNHWFAIPERRRQLEELKASGRFDLDMKYGTVGAVARDAAGHVAAATSTGGLTAKRWGRIGDSPLIGAGTYADDRAGAVSCTGAGEFFIRVGVAHEICARLRLGGERLQDAVTSVLGEVVELGGTGGLIALTPGGEAHWRFTTPGMYRGRVSDREEAIVAVFGDEG